MHVQRKALSISLYGRVLLVLTLLCALLQWSVHPVAASYQKNLVGPAGSGQFGYSVIALPSGNLVVTDPYYDSVSAADVGAVYLYNGLTIALISTLTGSAANDRVGYDGVKVLTNGNFVVLSTTWNNGLATSVGAATWGSATTGVSGVVSSTNSLVGSNSYDKIGSNLTPLTNGNYVVSSVYWDSMIGLNTNVGAVTWGDGTIGTSGVVSPTNSLVGSNSGDQVGTGVTALTNGNYVVRSPDWRGGTAKVGAVTWGDGASGMTTGQVSTSNSLYGSTINDQVGSGGITALTNGNYVVSSPALYSGGTADVGAATWGDGTIGVTGPVSVTNSLVGSTAYDKVGSGGVVALTNGNYVVASSAWSSYVAWGGAATWGNGTSGTKGIVSTTNSLYGTTAIDQVGFKITALTNGNYVVCSVNWDNGGTVDVGAATWVYGAASTGYPVSAANSLIGSAASDRVCSNNVIALTNDNYLVLSNNWDNDTTANVGAATLGDGSIGTVGTISSGNSLVGSTNGDGVGFSGIALSNGNYVVGSKDWNNGSALRAGAVTWGNGISRITGPVSTSNSLVGSVTDDWVGSSLLALKNSDYLVASPYWDNSSVVDAGAATWGDGSSGVTGSVSTSNSLVGSASSDLVGFYSFALANGDYAVLSPSWSYGASSGSGAITWGLGSGGLVGPITAENSVLGLVMAQGASLNFTHNTVYGYLAVGRPAENLVTLFWLPRLYLPVSKK